MISNGCMIAPKKGNCLMDGFLYRKDRIYWTTAVKSLNIKHFQTNIISYTLFINVNFWSWWTLFSIKSNNSKWYGQTLGPVCWKKCEAVFPQKRSRLPFSRQYFFETKRHWCSMGHYIETGENSANPLSASAEASDLTSKDARMFW